MPTVVSALWTVRRLTWGKMTVLCGATFDRTVSAHNQKLTSFLQGCRPFQNLGHSCQGSFLLSGEVRLFQFHRWRHFIHGMVSWGGGRSKFQQIGAKAFRVARMEKWPIYNWNGKKRTAATQKHVGSHEPCSILCATACCEALARKSRLAFGLGGICPVQKRPQNIIECQLPSPAVAVALGRLQLSSLEYLCHSRKKCRFIFSPVVWPGGRMWQLKLYWCVESTWHSKPKTGFHS